MMDDTDSLMSDLERQRLELEENVSSLQKSLYHWRLWEAEYDGLREEIAELKERCTKEDLLKAGREFGGTLVNEKEIKELVGEGRGSSRSKDQVMGLISRRIDYVQENVRVFENRLSAAEEKLNALLASEQSAVVKQESLPVTEIVEELDDEGKVVSSSTTTPDQAAPTIIDVLKKAGIELPSRPDRSIQQAPESTEPRVKEVEEPVEAPKESVRELEAVTGSDRNDVAPEQSSSSEQSLAPGFQASTESVSNIPTRGSLTPGISNDATSSHEDSEGDISSIVENESPDDAALRREMLQYGLDEVGAVVAELDLDDDGSEFSIDDDEDYEYVEDETDEEEDEYGRTTRRVIDDDYRKQMLELERKLNAKGLQNIGPDPSSLPVEVRDELGNPSAMKTDVPENNAENPTKKKKKVAFAEDLDIAPAPEPPAQAKPTKAPEVPEVAAIQDTVLERVEPAKPTTPVETKPPKKVSRFKSSRNSGVPVTPETQSAPEPSKPRPSFANTAPTSIPLFPAKPSEPKPFSQPIQDPDATSPPPSQPKAPEDKPLANTIIERETSAGAITPPDPDGLDETLHRQEVATEFYRMRNRKIQQSGGFLEDEEPEIVPLDEPPKKVSRFKAARAK